MAPSLSHDRPANQLLHSVRDSQVSLLLLAHDHWQGFGAGSILARVWRV
jgi:hypothetical protein